MPQKIVVLVGATILSGGFFTLGYIVGSRVKAPYQPGVRPSTPPDGVRSQPGSPAPIETTRPPVERQSINQIKGPLIPRGATLLQVAALESQGDALALAETLQQKGFPAFVLTPTDDHYYRVQIGPYPDRQSAKSAKQALEREGFQAIIKRKI